MRPRRAMPVPRVLADPDVGDRGSVATASTVASPTCYQASVRSIHPGAIRDPSRNWTYRGDTVRVAFRNAAARPSDGRGYRVCYTKNRRLACRSRRILGRSWDAWRVRIMPPWAGFVNGRYRRYGEFTWRIDRQVVARKRIWVYE
jgi:hypothetical protein